MRLQEQILLLVVGSWILFYELASYGWLGPYGLPGDNLHLLLLVMVLTFTFLVYTFVSTHTRQEGGA